MASNDSPRFILLLPPLPSPPTLSTLKTAFGPTLSQVLQECASHSSSNPQATILEIALACPLLAGHEHTPRASLYQTTQAQLAAVYKLVCIIAAQDAINVEDADGVDVRVLLVSWSPADQMNQEEEESSKPTNSRYGPIVSLSTLATSGRNWQYAFGVESEDGEAFVRAFVAAKQRNSPSTTSSEPITTLSPNAQKHSPQLLAHHHHVAVGGTFDHLHIGHKLLLHMTVFAVDPASPSVPRSATVGITGDALLVKKAHAAQLESWSARQTAVQKFLDAILDFSPHDDTTTTTTRDSPRSVDRYYADGLTVCCTEIQDAYGPTITEERIAALVISGETRAGGEAVNAKRREQGWAELEVFEVEVLDAEDGDGDDKAKEGFEGKISSTAIREKIARKTDAGDGGAGVGI